jgi:hypothetical protein
VTETNLPHSVRQWQNGDKQACGQVCEWLWQRLSAAAVRFVYELLDPGLEDHDRMQQATDLASDAFWAAMEELDLKVSGGRLLTAPTGNHREVRQRDGRVVSRPVFRGLVSDREPSARAPLDWRGEESFAALCHTMWTARCWDAVRGTTPFWQQTPIGPTRDAEEEEQSGIFEDELVGDLPDGQTFTVEKDNLRAFIEGLAQVTEQLRFQGNKALADVGDALLRYVREHLQAAHVGDGRIFIEFEEAEAWAFVRDTLGLKRDAAYKRKERFVQTVQTLPQAPVFFQKKKLKADRLS